jgi:signal peptidase I
MRSLTLRIVALTILVLVTSSTLASCVGQVYEVIGAAMEPSFYAGQSITAVAVAPDHIARGDAVVYALENGDIHFKRIVGLPGETIRIDNGRVFVDGQSLDEPYLAVPEGQIATPNTISDSNSTAATLREDEFFVLGDNRSASYDSRHHGPVTSDSIVGRVKVTFLNRLTGW